MGREYFDFVYVFCEFSTTLGRVDLATFSLQRKRLLGLTTSLMRLLKIDYLETPLSWQITPAVGTIGARESQI